RLIPGGPALPRTLLIGRAARTGTRALLRRVADALRLPAHRIIVRIDCCAGVGRPVADVIRVAGAGTRETHRPLRVLAVDAGARPVAGVERVARGGAAAAWRVRRRVDRCAGVGRPVADVIRVAGAGALQAHRPLRILAV